MKTLFTIFTFTAIVTHIWTTVIAFTVAGFWAGILSLIFPVLAEIYWVIRLFGINDLYVVIALIHLILAIPFSMMYRRNRA